MQTTSIIDHLPYAVLWKDKNSLYRGGNRVFLQSLGVQSVDMIFGKSDYDMPWGKLYAQRYLCDDHQVLAGKAKLYYLEPHIHASGKKVMVRVCKNPWYDDKGGIQGLICSYEIIAAIQDETLPPQQIKCLQLTAQGHTAKQIAKKLKLTPRTVEFYLQLIKHKLNCRNKTELVQKAYNSGLLSS